MIKLLIKGFIMGIANIIPGVSGGTLAITLGIYEKMLDAIGNFRNNIKENIKFLIPIGLGAVISLLALSNVISFTLENYPIETTCLFIGLILGGIPILTKKTKLNLNNTIYFLITFLLVIALTCMQTSGNVVSFSNMNILDYILVFGVGIVAAGTMIIPGISGSFVLMMLGYYEAIINSIKDLTHFNDVLSNLLVLIPLGVGILIGIVFISKIISYLIKKHESSTYAAILGFVISSIISIVMKMNTNGNIIDVLLGIVILVIGVLISRKLGDK
jgi:putative membrane protein